MDVAPIRNAILSVSDKLGLETFARGLFESGIKIFSTGGTRRILMEAAIPCEEVAEYTGFPEMLDGRVKTLHPKVHGGILARREMAVHMETLESQQILPFDMIVVNLYPFDQTIARPDCTWEQAIEQIDIGGPSMIRAAAKNHSAVTVITDYTQYAEVLQEIRELRGTRLATRRKLAEAAFELTAHYDLSISRYFQDNLSEDEFAHLHVISCTRKQPLRYGENPHQSAAVYLDSASEGASVATARKLHGKELSYNNILDLDSALLVASEFQEPAAVVIKHNNPCGAAVAGSLEQAFLYAYEGDPVSAFGSVLGFSQRVDIETAAAIADPGRFIEAIIAPGFEPDAVEILTSRPSWKNSVRLIEVGDLSSAKWKSGGREYRRITGGFLIQDRDAAPEREQDWRAVTDREPSAHELADLRFAWKIAKHVKSNAIVFAKDRQIVGVGAGQMNRLESVELAARKAGEKSAGAVAASDAFFPFRDGPDRAIEAGIRAIIQPGGSKRDAESIEACNEHGVAMVFTGRRHFKH